MKISELIEQLSKHNLDTEVLLEILHDGELVRLIPGNIRLSINRQEYLNGSKRLDDFPVTILGVG